MDNVKYFYIVVTEKWVKNYWENSSIGLHDSSVKTKENQYCIHMFYFLNKYPAAEVTVSKVKLALCHLLITAGPTNDTFLLPLENFLFFPGEGYGVV